MSQDGNSSGLGTMLRELGDDSGRPLLPEEQILASGQRARRRRRVARVGGAAVACAVLAIGAIALPQVSLFGREPVATATAATYFRDVAGKVSTTEDPLASRYWRVEAEATSGFATVTRTVLWNGSQGDDYVSYFGGRPERAEDWQSFGPRYTRAELAALPADPAALREVLVAKARGLAESDSRYAFADSDEAVLVSTTSLLVAPMSPAARRALFTLLGENARGRLAGTVQDRVGRTGTAVQFDRGEEGLRYILAEDGRLLEMVSSDRDGAMTITLLSQEGVDRVK